MYKVFLFEWMYGWRYCLRTIDSPMFIRNRKKKMFFFSKVEEIGKKTLQTFLQFYLYSVRGCFMSVLYRKKGTIHGKIWLSSAHNNKKKRTHNIWRKAWRNWKKYYSVTSIKLMISCRKICMQWNWSIKNHHLFSRVVFMCLKWRAEQMDYAK